MLWTARVTGATFGLPVVSGGTLYLNGGIGLYGFDATGTRNCSGAPKTCHRIWYTARPSATFLGRPIVESGQVFVYTSEQPDGSDATGSLYAYDAAGKRSCSGTPGVCQPLWTGLFEFQGGYSTTTPAGGEGYVAAGDAVFDATGTRNCSGTPLTCEPIWTGIDARRVAIANGVIFAVWEGTDVYAYDLKGEQNCSGTPRRCEPLWRNVGGGAQGVLGVTVANGVVYAPWTEDTEPGVSGGQLLVYDAAGVRNCGGTPKVCQPLYDKYYGFLAGAPVVANGTVYSRNSTDPSNDPTCQSEWCTWVVAYRP